MAAANLSTNISKRDFFHKKIDDLPRKVFNNVKDMETYLVSTYQLDTYSFELSSEYIRSFVAIVQWGKSRVYVTTNIDQLIVEVAHRLEMLTLHYLYNLENLDIRFERWFDNNTIYILQKINGLKSSSLKYKEQRND